MHFQNISGICKKSHTTWSKAPDGPTRLVLCGLPKSGKSFFGQKAAHILGWRHIDTDRQIEAEYQRQGGHSFTCRQIFCMEGETAFRQREKAILQTLVQTQQRVISLGGGILENSQNEELVKTIGCVVYLNTPVKVIWSRLCCEPQLPAYLDRADPYGSLQRLASRRRHQYERVADRVIDMDGKQTEQVLALLLTYGE